MTPVTRSALRTAYTAYEALQRIRGRMTPVTQAPRSARGARRRASTDPGPDDPGDEDRVFEGLPPDEALQRIRGRMTPATEISGWSMRPLSSRLQRIRGRMTPVTPRDDGGARRAIGGFNGSGAG